MGLGGEAVRGGKIMKGTVAILGGGHGAHAMAADLASRGFAVNLYEMPQFIANLRRLVDTRVIMSSGGMTLPSDLCMARPCPSSTQPLVTTVR